MTASPAFPDRRTRPLLALASLNRNALVTALARAGRAVVGGRDFAHADARYREEGCAGALVDLRDEGAEGLDAIRALAPMARVLAIVPGRDLRWIEAAIDAGAHAYLTSPFAPAELVQAVRLVAGNAPETAAPPLAARGQRRHSTLQEVERRREEGPVACLVVAPRRFEAVNGAFGRDVGDQLLQAVGQRIASAARALDPRATVSRLEGAEFAVVAPARVAPAIADAIVRRLDRPFMVADQIVAIGCRVGSAEAREGEGAAALLARAGAALAQARLSEASAPIALGQADGVDALADAALDVDLRRALENGGIEILFQPQLSVSTGAVVGAEALARWRHPTHGSLSAATLLAVAARSEAMLPLSRRLQQLALDAAAAWPAALEHLRLAVNVTAVDIAQPQFAAEFIARAAAAGVPPARVTLEITENGLIDRLEDAAAHFATLREAGFRIAIDDFGTGFSSLAWLKALPLDVLKLDKELSGDILGAPRDRVVVRGVIDMARSLGLAVVCEGVESEAQLALLAADGCNYWQGFLYAPPLASADFIARVTDDTPTAPLPAGEVAARQR